MLFYITDLFFGLVLLIKSAPKDKDKRPAMRAVFELEAMSLNIAKEIEEYCLDSQ